MSPPWPILGVETMRALEAAAFASGISESQLQANAAAEIADVVASVLPGGGKPAHVLVLIGPGNNGRDAFLAGRLLARRGSTVDYWLGPRHAVTPAELDQLEGGRENTLHLADEDGLARLGGALNRATTVLDGLFGIGVRGPLRPPLDRAVEALNVARSGPAAPLVVSVDVPSGIDADSGAVAGIAVRADLTVALGAVKAGCLRFPAAEYVGRLVPRPIGLPPGADRNSRVRLLTESEAGPLVPPRPLSAHKGTQGWVLLIGGCHEYVGAPILSAGAAGRSGCGLVALAVPPNVQAAAAAALPEATFVLRDDEQAAGPRVEQLLERLKDFRSLVIGPGLGRSEASAALVRGLLPAVSALSKPPAIVLDADALNVLAHWDGWAAAIPPGCVLTPHYGEMARLIGLPPPEVGKHSWELAAEWATRWGQVVVLKGPFTAVAEPDGDTWVYPRANPALSTAGTGDVLAGLIGGLAAQGLSPPAAARLAVVVHAAAARRATKLNGWRSLLATDLLPQVPAVMQELALPGSAAR